jgi:hypothetical protein
MARALEQAASHLLVIGLKNREFMAKTSNHVHLEEKQG